MWTSTRSTTSARPRARAQIEAARARGKRAMVRLQINHTVECATAPNWPLIANLYEKFANLRALGVEDAMTSWNFGCNPDTLNTFAFTRFFREPEWRDAEEFLDVVAREYFGVVDGAAVGRAWCAFGDAVRPYPFGFGLLYFSPFNFACAAPLPDHDTRTRPMRLWNFTAPGEEGDMFEQSVEPYGLAEVVDRLGLMHSAWAPAVTAYAAALAAATEEAHAEQELNVARYFGHLVHSAWVFFSWFGWRYHRDTVPGLDAAAMRQRLAAELENLEAVAALLERDQRLGLYEEDRKYYVTPILVRAKRTDIAKLMEALG